MFKNKYCIKGDYVEIEVKEKDRIENCIIDLIDFQKIKELDKTLSLFQNKNYVYFTLNRKKIRLHRFLTNCPDNKIVDHINRNPLDNRQENLRCIDNVLNLQNVIAQKNSTSKIRGVYHDKKRNKYRGFVQVDHKRYFLGWFDNIEDCRKKVIEFRNEKIEEYNKIYKL